MSEEINYAQVSTFLGFYSILATLSIVVLAAYINKVGRLKVWSVTNGQFGESVKSLSRFGLSQHSEEDQAVLYSMHSRSPDKVENLISRIYKTGSSAFIEKYVIGYGHESVLDNAEATLTFENVSILAAKAIQNDPLYRGTESSTRYLDFSKQELKCMDGACLDYAKKLVEFYELAKAVMFVKIDEQGGTDVWIRAQKARVFDVIRGFLPAGVATNLTLRMSIRQLSEHLVRLQCHPFPEVRSIAASAWEACSARYPGSFNNAAFEKARKSSEGLAKLQRDLLDIQSELLRETITVTPGGVSIGLLTNYLRDPEKARPLPEVDLHFPVVRGCIELDYGCHRDLSRHNSLTKSFPLLTPKLGFESWYYDNLPPELKNQAVQLVKEGVRLYDRETAFDTGSRRIDCQYFLPLGFKVRFHFSAGYRALDYILRLRTGKTVHPILRAAMQNLGAELEKMAPGYFHYNKDESEFQERRGLETIEEKKR